LEKLLVGTTFGGKLLAGKTFGGESLGGKTFGGNILADILAVYRNQSLSKHGN